MSKFKIGDRVMVIGAISGTVIDINPNGVIVECDEPSKGVEIYQYPNKMVLWPNESQVELIAPSRYELHITCNDSKTTNAVYKVNGKIEKRTEAVCAPSDTFNFNTGAELAINRVLYGTDYNPKDVAFKPTQPIAPQEDKPKFKVGQRVVGEYGIGTIIGISKDGVHGVEFDDAPPYGHNCKSGEFIHEKSRSKDGYCRWQKEKKLEPYSEPQKEPEPVYYSGEVVCVKTDGDGTFTVGKVYEFVDGQVLDNESCKRPTGMKIKSLGETYMTSWYYSFIPYLGEA